jgi:ABC-type nitrate/sulfonate/bicarbonate transport system substrate-binding protein
VVTKTKNASKSTSSSDLGTTIIKNTANLRIESKKVVETIKTLVDTTVKTKVVVTKVEKWAKAKKTGPKFTFAMGSPGISGTLMRESLARMNFKYGTQGEFLEIADSDLVVAGGAAGKFEMGSSSTASVMKVIQLGSPMVFVGENSRNQWTLVGKNGLNTCADLNGKRLGLHSPGGVSTALYRAWAIKNCGASKPSELFIAGSPNRLTALIGGQLDVTMMEVEDTLSLPAGQYRIISNFSRDLTEIKTGLIWANKEFLNQNKVLVGNLMYENIRMAQEINGSAKSFSQMVLKWAPEYKNLDAIVAAYQAAALFPIDGGTFFKDLDTSSAFYAKAGSIKPGLLATDMASLVPLNLAKALLKL